MRYHEISGGIKVQLTNEEANFIEAMEQDSLDIAELNEHEQVVAVKLLHKGILNLQEEGKPSIVKVNKPSDIWRM